MSNKNVDDTPIICEWVSAKAYKNGLYNLFIKKDAFSIYFRICFASVMRFCPSFIFFKTLFAHRSIKVVVGYINVDAAQYAWNTIPATKARRKRTFTVATVSGGQFEIYYWYCKLN